MRTRLDNSFAVIIACGVFHNIAIEQNLDLPPPPDNLDNQVMNTSEEWKSERIIWKSYQPNLFQDDAPEVIAPQPRNDGTVQRRRLINLFA